MARLKCLERKLDANPALKLVYAQKISEYIEKGYFVKLNNTPTGNRTWYLPHFPVTNVNKPNKLRIVFDAAAKTNGKSLNDHLMNGPDLLASLPAVLFRFRQRRIGFVGDIREMYHRVAVRESDRNSQLILWRGDDRVRNPDVYQMTAMTFGASCSPSAAMYIKNRNAMEFADNYPEAAKIIVDSHYVDDCLASADTEEIAIKLIKDVIHVHSEGGFEIRNWSCSSKSVLEAVPEKLRATESMDVAVNKLERVLGIWWSPTSDTFTFKFQHTNPLYTHHVPTKRKVLQIVMSLYDPLGMIAHILVKGRLIMQRIWRSEIGWDDEITTDQYELWQIWLQKLSMIERIEIPRCYSLLFPAANDVQLHIFCDASEEAYCAVAYWRIRCNDAIETAFIVAKARVVPLKPTTIPRLELQAALIGSRLAATIVAEHTFKPNQIVMWTDSRTVLCWLRSNNGRFKQYVASRVGEILECTNVSSWRWVSTKQNVADVGTRMSSDCGFEPDNWWYTGPIFIRRPESEWPVEVLSSNTDEEVIHHTFALIESVPLFKFERMSSAMKCVRVLGYVRRFCQNARSAGGRRTGALDAEEINFAQTLCIRLTQKESFGDDVEKLLNKLPLRNDSKLKKLCPFVDADNLLRIGSRLQNFADADDNSKSPIILEGKHQYCQLLVLKAHVHCHHQNDATVLNELRQKYWILGAKRAVKKVKFGCIICRNRKAKPDQQLMGQLPVARFQIGMPPFAHTGVDYFGPLNVVIGRRHEKRYGALFTCMTCRAVHIELASSLSTDSFIMAFRRFVARRGQPKVMYSDNGTNFRGAYAELNQSMKSILGNDGIKWKFIPPMSPHFGGCWERMVRSVKSCLAITLSTKVPTEELLLTLLTEVEHTLNSRPLTDVPLEHIDDDAITPNHLLMGRSSGMVPFGEFNENDVHLRKQWRASQRLADMFWALWVKSYLPSLTLRSKWHKVGRKLAVNDLVLVADSNQPRDSWPKGLVVQTYPGKDGEVRAVDIRTTHGILKRPVHKVCLLEMAQ